MPGLLNPMIRMNVRVQETWKKLHDSIYIDEEHSKVYKIAINSPLHEIDILNITEMAYICKVPREYLVDYFLARRDVPHNTNSLIEDYFQLKNIQQVLDLHQIV